MILEDVYIFIMGLLKQMTPGSISCGAHGKCSKISNTSVFLFADRMLVIRARWHKMLV